MTFQFNKLYFFTAILLFFTEILIAIYLKTGFIRYTVGDFLSVILLYYFFRSFLIMNRYKLATAVLAIAFLIEFMQLVDILKWMNLEKNQLLKIILGSTFEVSDLIAYALGIIAVLFTEHIIMQKRIKLKNN